MFLLQQIFGLFHWLHSDFSGLWHFPQTKSQQNKFNQSVDLEAGMIESNLVHTTQWKQTDEQFPQEHCTEQQQQWIEQEY